MLGDEYPSFINTADIYELIISDEPISKIVHFCIEALLIYKMDTGEVGIEIRDLPAFFF